MIVDPEKFALAVVQSSDSSLTVADKLGLFEEAYQAAVTRNQPIVDAKNKKKADSVKAFLNSY
ncbi:hypothetical protein [Streptococcus hillyeri]|uniref:Uncharacterized protein n=1 Tax=Streptococcus hillyeri TaxID=2282420 RepID=A0A3L9DQG2_9STRE|nr:hypothetical protein [Streptococcus hillyeri]RLY02193.1 hypothetical protein EAF07_08045 [Streptococcus hillyeri]